MHEWADRSLQIRPIAGALGAEISGVDLSENLDTGTIAAIRRAWLDHLVIFFRDQELPPERFLAFARRFGEVVEYPFLNGLDGFPEITPVVKLEHERVNFGGLWHSDTAYLEGPPMGKDMSEAESAPLLQYLFAHQQRPEFTCRFRWGKGGLAFWDNRRTEHNPINDYHGFRRIMHRLTLAGDIRADPPWRSTWRA